MVLSYDLENKDIYRTIAIHLPPLAIINLGLSSKSLAFIFTDPWIMHHLAKTYLSNYSVPDPERTLKLCSLVQQNCICLWHCASYGLEKVILSNWKQYRDSYSKKKLSKFKEDEILAPFTDLNGDTNHFWMIYYAAKHNQRHLVDFLLSTPNASINSKNNYYPAYNINYRYAGRRFPWLFPAMIGAITGNHLPLLQYLFNLLMTVVNENKNFWFNVPHPRTQMTEQEEVYSSLWALAEREEKEEILSYLRKNKNFYFSSFSSFSAKRLKKEI